MLLIVFSNLPKPSNAKYSHCIGIITESAAVNAFKVSRPSEGAQSIIYNRSHLLRSVMLS
jgi:hypothetical protein